MGNTPVHQTVHWFDSWVTSLFSPQIHANKKDTTQISPSVFKVPIIYFFLFERANALNPFRCLHMFPISRRAFVHNEINPRGEGHVDNVLLL